MNTVPNYRLKAVGKVEVCSEIHKQTDRPKTICPGVFKSGTLT